MPTATTGGSLSRTRSADTRPGLIALAVACGLLAGMVDSTGATRILAAAGSANQVRIFVNRASGPTRGTVG